MISVIIPSYNQSEYLDECIESVLTQIVKPHEIILVDDGSTDNSLKIARKYPIKVISQVNKGLSSARNTGIMNATGDWILPLDADDILLPNAIERLEQTIKETSADVIGLSFKEFGLRQTQIILMPNPKMEDFKEGNRIGYCSAVRKSKLLEIGGYSPRMIFGYEDLALWFDLLLRGAQIITIPEILWLYRTKEKSMIHDALTHHEELMAQIFKDFPEITKIINNPLPV